jgi:hypothetical protein
VALKAKLNLTIDTTHRKSHFADMVTSTLACSGAVLIPWQHEDIALEDEDRGSGDQRAKNPDSDWNRGDAQRPNESADGKVGARCALVFIFD